MLFGRQITLWFVHWVKSPLGTHIFTTPPTVWKWWLQSSKKAMSPWFRIFQISKDCLGEFCLLPELHQKGIQKKIQKLFKRIIEANINTFKIISNAPPQKKKKKKKKKKHFFGILEIQFSTTSLHSTPVQNPGGWSEPDTRTQDRQEFSFQYRISSFKLEVFQDGIGNCTWKLTNI